MRISRGTGSVRFDQEMDKDNLYLYNSDASKIYMTWKENGNIGVGTTNPNAKLDVQGSAGTVQLLVKPNSTGTAIAKIAGNGNAHAHLDIDAAYSSYIDFLSAGNTKWQIGRPSGTYDFEIYNSNLSSASLFIQSTSGNVGIGTTDTKGYKFAVNGDAIFNKVKVKQYPWPDYVFYPDYKLLTLREVEAFIQRNKHLPGVPSAKEVEDKGLDVGESQAVLLKKIEELTLYIIEQQKEIESLKEEIKTIRSTDK
jgi:hypothetical protein